MCAVSHKMAVRRYIIVVAVKELENVLKLHARLYPDLQPTDAVKLIYQNEFGGGHLISDPQKSLDYLLSEAERTPSNGALPLFVPIGNGLVRVNIAAVTACRLEFERLNEIFVRSAANVSGNMESFFEKLEHLHRVAAEGVFAFSATELEGYLSEYIKTGCPMVSHSSLYREKYSPAYRVVLKKLLTAELSAAGIDSEAWEV